MYVLSQQKQILLQKKVEGTIDLKIQVVMLQFTVWEFIKDTYYLICLLRANVLLKNCSIFDSNELIQIISFNYFFHMWIHENTMADRYKK